jgi:hypothetical protein
LRQNLQQVAPNQEKPHTTPFHYLIYSIYISVVNVHCTIIALGHHANCVTKFKEYVSVYFIQLRQMHAWINCMLGTFFTEYLNSSQC